MLSLVLGAITQCIIIAVLTGMSPNDLCFYSFNGGLYLSCLSSNLLPNSWKGIREGDRCLP